MFNILLNFLKCFCFYVNFRNQIQDESDLVKEACAAIVGKLSCCLSGTFSVQPPSADSAIKHAACDILCNGLTATSAHEKTCSVQACVFKPFLILLENKVSSSVKLGRNLFYYVSVRSPFLICIALGRWFCFVVGFFFFS